MTGIVGGKVERALVIRGDALRLPLRDNSVDICITSPPYFNLRSYGTGHEMEVGSEATPAVYLEALWAATAEMARVLKPTGSIWINLGDKFAERGGPERAAGADGGQVVYRAARPRRKSEAETGIREKSLMGLPWRYAIGCIDQLGLILRAELIWSKVNSLPESVTDRVRRSHETWFHFTRELRYFAALDELREPHADSTLARAHLPRKISPNDGLRKQGNPIGRTVEAHGVITSESYANNPLGKLPGSVWSIPNEPLRLPPWIDTAHYAAFPTEWPRRLILGFTPHLICDVCKVGRFPIIDRRNIPLRPGDQAGRAALNGEGIHGPDRRAGTHVKAEATILGYACACTPYTDHPRYQEELANPRGLVREYHLDRWTPPPGHPALVLDPFGGTGCSAHVARALGRHAITIDLSEPYCRLAADQTLARQRAGKVLGRVHLERQGTLL